ncbi:MAG TPA: hypothetical protein VNQ57_06310 [Ureibacillus sp.]|nr:hypothetical protein [Ureibacillus sp.]
MNTAHEIISKHIEKMSEEEAKVYLRDIVVNYVRRYEYFNEDVYIETIKEIYQSAATETLNKNKL